jgi:hypothetical protein
LGLTVTVNAALSAHPSDDTAPVYTRYVPAAANVLAKGLTDAYMLSEKAQPDIIVAGGVMLLLCVNTNESPGHWSLSFTAIPTTGEARNEIVFVVESLQPSALVTLWLMLLIPAEVNVRVTLGVVNDCPSIFHTTLFPAPDVFVKIKLFPLRH